MFLTDIEWEVLRRFPPVRRSGSGGKRRGFVPKGPPTVCHHCGKPSNPPGNPLQICHLIPFLRGVIDGGLSPVFLNHPDNLVWAHRSICNKAVEIPQTMWPSRVGPRT